MNLMLEEERDKCGRGGESKMPSEKVVSKLFALMKRSLLGGFLLGTGAKRLIRPRKKSPENTNVS